MALYSITVFAGTFFRLRPAFANRFPTVYECAPKRRIHLQNWAQGILRLDSWSVFHKWRPYLSRDPSGVKTPSTFPSNSARLNRLRKKADFQSWIREGFVLKR